MVQKLHHFRKNLQDFHQQHEVLVAMAGFLLGFIFDLYTIRRVDDLFFLIQQSFYLVLLGTLILIEIRIKLGTFKLSVRGMQFWQFHDVFVHFLFGSLLAAYTIFYFSSASTVTSFLFITLLACLMLANEIPSIRKIGIPVRVILYCICLLSFFSFFYPMLFGRVGPLPFWLGVLSSAGLLAIVAKTNFRQHLSQLKSEVIGPAIVVHALFLIGYYTSLIPPVPVAVKKIGIYYQVEKKDGKYLGKHLRSFWDRWTWSGEEFQVRNGDKVFVLVSIFSPAKFEDQVNLKWWHDDPKAGWMLEDTIPLPIKGGRQEGFRGFASKQYYRPGHWKVIVETSDGREVGRINVEIRTDSGTAERNFQTDRF